MAATAEILNQVDILGPKPVPFNLNADFEKSGKPSVEKYLAERDKRLKQSVSGIDQYRLVEEDGIFKNYLKDPWVEPGFTREPVKEVVDVVIVGGGYGAQLVAVKLIEAGITNVRLIEKAGDFGGTWYWWVLFHPLSFCRC